ncbi:T9SS type A sorting domain-containing protein, partial [Reichenbachiella sp.]
TMEFNGHNGFHIPGIDATTYLGREIRFIGDINNDGLEDVAIGNPDEKVGDLELAGRAYIIFGSTAPYPTPFDLTTLDGTNGFVVEAIAYDERRGASMAALGDINGDGIDDVMIATSNTTSDDIVLYGSSSFAAKITVSDINGTNGFLLDTPGSNQADNLGDVNGDLINDFIIGTPHFSGQAWIVFGRSTNFPATVDVTYLDGTNGFRTSTFAGSRPSYKVGGAGDINNDGYNDIMLGNWASSAPDEISYVLFGKGTAFDEVVDIEAVDGSDGFKIDNSGNGFLTFVGTIGDINGDGIDDCYSENNIIFGSEDPFSSFLLQSDLDGDNGFVIENYVLCAAPAGDVNEDGIDDLYLSGSQANYIIFGTKEGFPSLLDPSTLDGIDGFQLTGLNNANIGRPMDAGDLNNDGKVDFFTDHWSAPGNVYAIFGGDYFLMPLNDGYPKAENITDQGFDIIVSTQEKGTVHYALFTSDYATVVDHARILSGEESVSHGNFEAATAHTEITKVLTGLDAGTTYKLYLFFEDEVALQGEIHLVDNIRTKDVPETERDALISLYTSAGGKDWTDNTHWLTDEPVSTWTGITTYGGHVTEINLSGNSLSGTIPIQLEDLKELTTLNLSDNNLSGTIPDLTSLPNFNQQFLIQNNAFQFGDFENQFAAYASSFVVFTYSPQAKVDDVETVEKAPGESVTLTTMASGSANEYQWYKNGNLIPGAISSSLALESFNTEDAAEYMVQITSTIVTGLTLERNDISLVVGADTEAPLINCPENQQLECHQTLPDYTALAEASDNKDENPDISQTPIAGSPFTDGMVVTLTATDASGNQSTCSLTVGLSNAPTVSNPLADQVIPMDEAYQSEIPVNTFTQTDTNVVVWSATLEDGTSLPDWLSFNSDTRQLSGMPTTEVSMAIQVTATYPCNYILADDFGLNTADEVLAIDTPVLVGDYLAYPNPANDFLKIKLNHDLKGAYQISLINLSGKEVYHSQFTKSKQHHILEMNVKGIPAGSYILKISNNATITTMNVLIR